MNFTTASLEKGRRGGRSADRDWVEAEEWRRFELMPVVGEEAFESFPSEGTPSPTWTLEAFSYKG